MARWSLTQIECAPTSSAWRATERTASPLTTRPTVGSITPIRSPWAMAGQCTAAPSPGSAAGVGRPGDDGAVDVVGWPVPVDDRVHEAVGLGGREAGVDRR